MKTLSVMTLAATALATAGTAQAQSGYWSYDGKTQYSSYQDCERARTTNTIGGAAIGGLIGAGLGALAGGDDTRNAVVGSAVGAIAGGVSGRNSVSCAQTALPQTQAQYGYAGPQQTYYPSTTRYPSSAYGHSTYQVQHGPSAGYEPYTSRRYTTHSAPVTTRRVYSYTEPATVYRPAPAPTRVYTTPVYTQSHTGYRQPQTVTHYPSTPRTTAYYPSQYATPVSWTAGDGAYYNSQQSCQSAKRNRTFAAGGLGAVTGAGLGTLAGGNDRRNAAVGAVAGAVIGASAGNRSVQCYAVRQSSQNVNYGAHPSVYR